MQDFFKKKWIFILVTISLIALVGVALFQSNQKQKANEKILLEGKQLAEMHCTTCHIFPDPSLLTNELWNVSVLPNMGSRLGMKAHFDYFYPPVDFTNIPNKPVMPQQEWNKLVYYYLASAPDSLPAITTPRPAYDSIFFTAEPFMDFSGGIITTLTLANEKIYLAEAYDSSLYELDLAKSELKSIKYDWPVTDLDYFENQLLITSPGYLHPADHQKGKLITTTSIDANKHLLVDSLRRSLKTEIADFDQNGYPDFLICEFGHNFGQLSLYFTSDTGYQRKILSGTPGAICAQVHDFNQDGLDDFMVLFAQGDERLVLYTNQGNQKFRPETIHRFPSIYGSLYFELADFNQDGLQDILYTNGDNGDYTPIPKPYHGIRILINQGGNDFKEQWFYPMHGAAMARSFDFDQDAKNDIIATSNFSKSGKAIEEGLVLFHHKEKLNFEPFIFKNGKLNQWNLLEFVDIENDGDLDVLVGAMDLEAIRRQQSNVANENLNQKPSVLILKNNSRQ